MLLKKAEEFVYRAVLNGDLEIMEDGTIWRLRKRGWDRWTKQAVSRPCRPVRAERAFGEYLAVRAMIDGKRITALAHRLVYRHFKGQIPEGLTVNHENGKTMDNLPTNLVLATYSEQILHSAHVLGTARCMNQNGAENHAAKLTGNQVEEIRRRREAGEALNFIARDYGISFQAVSKIARGTRWANFPG